MTVKEAQSARGATTPSVFAPFAPDPDFMARFVAAAPAFWDDKGAWLPRQKAVEGPWELLAGPMLAYASAGRAPEDLWEQWISFSPLAPAFGVRWTGAAFFVAALRAHPQEVAEDPIREKTALDAAGDAAPRATVTPPAKASVETPDKASAGTPNKASAETPVKAKGGTPVKAKDAAPTKSARKPAAGSAVQTIAKASTKAAAKVAAKPVAAKPAAAEALRAPVDATPKPAKPRSPRSAARAAARGEAAAARKPAAPARVDDLTRLKGLGPKTAATLADAGVQSFADIAAITADQKAAVEGAAGAMKGRLQWDAWAAEAAKLAKEDPSA